MNALKTAAVAAAVLALAGTARGAATNGFSLQVVLDGWARPEYRARGAVYVEAVRGRPYVLRITNPLPCRVAVALAVDGLNTIDARHSDARRAAKWVLGPYESVEIPGWQVNGLDARQFLFTGERSSYGAWLGKTADLGVIEAVFFRERVHRVRAEALPVAPPFEERAKEHGADAGGPPLSGSAGAEGGVVGGAPGGVPEPPIQQRMEAPSSAPEVQRKLADEYAATGIGERTRHEVEWVNLDLEERPSAVVRIRYEFRDALVRLGVLCDGPDPLARRERAHGFSGGWCPDPGR